MSSTPIHGEDPEKGGSGITWDPIGHHPSLHQHPHFDQAKERLRHFLHPSGKRIHVAESPQAADKLRRQLETLHNEDEFDIFISGTPEHLEALRKAREHHEERRETLKTQHADLFEKFAEVHAELDVLSHELERVTSHGISLEAHFSKFGYGAHIKTYDDDSPSGSGTTTPRSSISSDKRSESSAEKGYATPLKLFKVPTVRQYFHHGTLWRASATEEVQSFELFVDLLYVGIIAINGDHASEHPTGLSLLRFVITFTYVLP